MHGFGVILATSALDQRGGDGAICPVDLYQPQLSISYLFISYNIYMHLLYILGFFSRCIYFVIYKVSLNFIIKYTAMRIMQKLFFALTSIFEAVRSTT